MILNEIQPRDNNDYFNQAKVLKEHDSFDLEDLNASVPNIDTSAEIKGSKYKISVLYSVFQWQKHAQNAHFI